jgi:hypothetical protein
MRARKSFLTYALPLLVLPVAGCEPVAPTCLADDPARGYDVSTGHTTTSDGVMAFTASNGDELWGTYEGETAASGLVEEHWSSTEVLGASPPRRVVEPASPTAIRLRAGAPSA